MGSVLLSVFAEHPARIAVWVLSQRVMWGALPVWGADGYISAGRCKIAPIPPPQNTAANRNFTCSLHQNGEHSIHIRNDSDANKSTLRSEM